MQFDTTLSLHTIAPGDDPIAQHAADELARLLGRVGVAVRRGSHTDGANFALSLSADAATPPPPAIDGVEHDGFSLHVTGDALTIAGNCAVALRHGVYDLAERMGFAFLMPGDDGELPPAVALDRLRLDPRRDVCNPRLARRGIFGLSSTKDVDYSAEQWLDFFAKLRFNAVAGGDLTPSHVRHARDMGFRVEWGGHELPKLLPRDLFEKDPEMFRLYQPEDFHGSRMGDLNFCATNPKARQIIMQAFKDKLPQLRDVYGLHFWAQDLPAAGWCYCPSCRALAPSDQAVLPLHDLARVLDEAGSDQRLAMLAYHDTILPPTAIAPPRRGYLLWAPRERCYAHALDDPACQRNRFYLEALAAWMDYCRDVEDPHTFEYYNDQILFRGQYPFLPNVILGDTDVYAEIGIASHLSLMVGGCLTAPDYNMLIFAASQWDAGLSADLWIAGLASRIDPAHADVWRDYLSVRADVFERAMRICDYDHRIFLDYRWLPEATNDFGRQMAATYADAARDLDNAASALAAATVADRSRTVRDRDAARARFEVADLMVMHHQQTMVNAHADYFVAGDITALHRMRDAHTAARAMLTEAKELFVASGASPDVYYPALADCLRDEFSRKLARYADGALFPALSCEP